MRELFFSVPIFYFDFKDHKQINRKLKKIILGWKDKEESLQRSNVLGWHSKVRFPEEVDFFTKMINDVQREIYIAEEYKFELKVDSMWAMVNKKYSYNKLHTHPGCHWAGVYYVQCPPKCGDIVFRFLEPRQSFPQPIFKKNTNELQPHQWETVHYEPKEGRVIMFPSYLGHEVEPNLSDKDRISISFNLIQEENNV